VERLDFIGITEYYEEGMRYFAARYLGSGDIMIPHKNRGPELTSPPLLDEETMSRLKTFHGRDYEIYNDALRIRHERNDGCQTTFISSKNSVIARRKITVFLIFND
jgi:hypothetical protein